MKQEFLSTISVNDHLISKLSLTLRDNKEINPNRRIPPLTIIAFFTGVGLKTNSTVLRPGSIGIEMKVLKLV